MQMLILAAGFGTRLLPVTNHIPKPLLPFMDLPAVERLVNQAVSNGFSTIVINGHHLIQMLYEWRNGLSLASLPAISREETIMDTGGAVAHARNLLHDDQPLLIWNGDIVSGLNPRRLMEYYGSVGAPDALLVVHRRAPFNKLMIADDARIISFSCPGESAMAFTGISVMGPDLIRRVPVEPVSLVTVWQQAIEDGFRVEAVELGRLCKDGSDYWEDFGTFHGLFNANRLLLDREHAGSPYLSPCAEIGDGVAFSGTVVINRDCTVGDRAVISNVVMLPGASIAPGTRVDGSIVTPWGSFNHEAV